MGLSYKAPDLVQKFVTLMACAGKRVLEVSAAHGQRARGRAEGRGGTGSRLPIADLSRLPGKGQACRERLG